jgi:hypothetical protein
VLDRDSPEVVYRQGEEKKEKKTNTGQNNIKNSFSLQGEMKKA